MPRSIPTAQGPVYLVDYDTATAQFRVSRDSGVTFSDSGPVVEAVEGYDWIQTSDRDLYLFVKADGTVTVYHSNDGGRTWATL